MKTNLLCLTVILLVVHACTSPPAVSNDAPTGVWSGNYEISPGRSETISVELRWEEANLRGVVRTGFRTLPVTKASFNRDTGAITIEFDAEGNGGRTVHYLVDGKVSGSTMTGTWSHDDQRGAFRVVKE